MTDNLPSVPMNASFRSEKSVQVRPGSWWRLKENAKLARSEAAGGTIMLCTEVEVAHGAVHTVHLRDTPASRTDEQLKKKYGPYSWAMLYDVLLAKFEPVPEAVALASRDREIAAIGYEISEVQSDIRDRQSDLQRISGVAAASPTALLGGVKGDDGESDAAGRQVLATRMQEDLQERAATITRISSEIAAANEAMQARSMRLAAYYEERSAAAMAIIKPIQAVAGRLMEQVDTMGLYAGTNVSAHLLVDGESAPAGEKLHLFQRKLYYDEELLIHLLDGGADFEDFHALVDRLRNDPDFVNRIFGTPRAAVLMQPRRNPKERITEGGIGAAIEKQMKEDMDKEAFMLIRDGGRIWVVDLPEFLCAAPRLFPTPDDLDAPYTQRAWYSDKPYRRIGIDDLGYAKAVEEFRQLAQM